MTATSTASASTGISGPAVLVCVSTGVTLPAAGCATYAVRPSGEIATPAPWSPMSIDDPALLVCVSTGVSLPSPAAVCVLT